MKDQDRKEHEAFFYEPYSGKETSGEKTVRCLLCPHKCVIRDGGTGRCRVRTNSGGVLYATSYGRVSSLALDPVEKKPLVQFHPGSFILSAGSWGCNLGCLFCQNHEISQTGVPEKESSRFYDRFFTSESLVQAALDTVSQGNIGLAYTYNEPFCGYEFVYDTSMLVRKAGLKNVLVTNGYVNLDPLKKILPYTDAMNIDLKAFTDSFYRKICGGTLKPVLDTIAASVAICHVEVTTLVIPGHNSSPDEINSIASWLASVSPEVPLHLNRHHPDWLMSEPAPISRDELYALADIARRHLKYVYTGNLG